MDVFVARQPIVDVREAVVAYELLFRPSADATAATGAGPNQMAAQVIVGAVSQIGFDTLVGAHLAYVNTTRDMLVDGMVDILPPGRTTIELLEQIEPAADVIAAVKRLKDRGFRIALDDFVYHPRFAPLMELADVIKIDVLDRQPGEVARVVRDLPKVRAVLLAERVETRACFDECVSLGFSLFQGYFFARPETMRGDALPASQLTVLRLLGQLNQPETPMSELAATIGQDISLTYGLLRMLNSPAVGLRRAVTSVAEAVVLIGEDALRRWATLVTLGQAAADRPPALLETARYRARLSELLAPAIARAPVCADAAFTVGLFSVLDVLFNRPMSEVVPPLNLPPHAAGALLHRAGMLGTLLNLVQLAEIGDWARALPLTRLLGVPPERLRDAQVEALGWVSRLEA